MTDDCNCLPTVVLVLSAFLMGVAANALLTLLQWLSR